MVMLTRPSKICSVLWLLCSLIVTGCAVLLALQGLQTLNTIFDHSMEQRWRLVGGLVAGAPLTAQPGADSAAGRIAGLGFQVLDKEGAVISALLREGVPPFPSRQLSADGSPLTTLRFDDLAAGTRTERVRVVTGPYEHPSGFHGFLQVAESAQALEAARTRIYVQISWLLPCAWLGLALAMLYFSRRSEGSKPQRNAAAEAPPTKGATQEVGDPETPELRARLAEALTKIEEISRSQGRLVGNIAHEIKTPLATVLSHAELIQACIDDPSKVQRYARSIAQDMEHLSDLVESFLRLASAFAQEDTSHHVPVHIHDVVTAAVARSQSLALEHGITIVTRLAESDGDSDTLEVLGDPILLESMIENIVRNAVRFSPRGARVELTVEALKETVVLRMRDHGIGIAKDQLESVFDWFFQGPTNRARSTGTGFGLALAKRVVGHHRGTISVRNLDEGGCEFEIRLRRWVVQEPAPGSISAA